MPSWRHISLKTRKLKDSGWFPRDSLTKQAQEDRVSLVNLQARLAKGAQESILTMKVSCTNIILQPVEQLVYIQGPDDQAQMILCWNNPQ